MENNLNIEVATCETARVEKYYYECENIENLHYCHLAVVRALVYLKQKTNKIYDKKFIKDFTKIFMGYSAMEVNTEYIFSNMYVNLQLDNKSIIYESRYGYNKYSDIDLTFHDCEITIEKEIFNSGNLKFLDSTIIFNVCNLDDYFKDDILTIPYIKSRGLEMNRCKIILKEINTDKKIDKIFKKYDVSNNFNLVYLTLNNMNIEYLYNLNKCDNLKELNLCANYINKLDNLYGLNNTNIKVLQLYNNDIDEKKLNIKELMKKYIKFNCVIHKNEELTEYEKNGNDNCEDLTKCPECNNYVYKYKLCNFENKNIFCCYKREFYFSF